MTKAGRRGTAVLGGVLLLLAGAAPLPALAGDPARLAAKYLDYVQVNSTDQPDIRVDYFHHLRLLNDFSRDFVAAYAAALEAAKREERAVLFDLDPFTGDANQCPIGETRAAAGSAGEGGAVTVEAFIDNSACNGDAAGSLQGVELRFAMVLEGHAGKAGGYVIDDVLRAGDGGAWHSFKTELREMAR